MKKGRWSVLKCPARFWGPYVTKDHTKLRGYLGRMLLREILYAKSVCTYELLIHVQHGVI